MMGKLALSSIQYYKEQKNKMGKGDGGKTMSKYVNVIILFFFLFNTNQSLPTYNNKCLLFNSSQLLGQIPFLQKNQHCCAHRIINGGYHLYNLRYDQHPLQLPASPPDLLTVIVDIMWYLYAVALNKNQPFDHGTLVIKDTHFGLYDLLMSYVKRVNKKITGTLTDTPSWISFNPFAYSRASTHFPVAQRSFRQYGIDVRFNISETVCPLLPSNKCHILFGIIDAELELIFIKLEHHGIYAYDGWFGHMHGFCSSRTRHALPSLEKILPTSWYNWIEKKVGHNDDPASRRERVPLIVKRTVRTILNKTNLSPIRKRHCLKSIDDFGIRALNALAHQDMIYLAYTMKHCASKKQLSTPWLPTQCINELKAYINELAVDYDYLNLRTGREVIVDDPELLTSLYYYLLVTDQAQASLLKPFFDNMLQLRLTTQAIRKLKHQGYSDSACPPLSIAYDSLFKNIAFFNDKTIDVMSIISPTIGQLTKEEIFKLNINK